MCQMHRVVFGNFSSRCQCLSPVHKQTFPLHFDAGIIRNRACKGQNPRGLLFRKVSQVFGQYRLYVLSWLYRCTDAVSYTHLTLPTIYSV